MRLAMQRYTVREDVVNLWVALRASQDFHVTSGLSFPNAHKKCTSIVKNNVQDGRSDVLIDILCWIYIYQDVNEKNGHFDFTMWVGQNIGSSSPWENLVF